MKEKYKIKVKYSKLLSKSTIELILMRKEFQIHNFHMKNKDLKGNDGYSPKEVRKNIARINQILNSRKE